MNRVRGDCWGKTSLNILLVDDHDLVRAGLRLLLEDLDGEPVFSEASSCEAALRELQRARFDLLLMDFHLPGPHGLPAFRLLRERAGSAAILVVSAENNPALIRKLLDEGAAGFVSKAAPPDELLAAVRKLLAGGAVARRVEPAAAPRPSLPGATRTFDQLTPRQVETLRLAMQGKANKVIARELKISDATVKAHLAAAFRALGVRNRTEAMFAVARTGLEIWPAAPPAAVAA